MPSPFIPQAYQNALNPFASLSSYGQLGSGNYGGDMDILSTNPATANPMVTQFQAPTAMNYGTGLTSQPLVGATGGGFGDWLKSTGILSSKDADGVMTQGWGAPALGIAQGALSAFMGMKQYGLAKETLAENKRQYAQNYDAQRTTTNSALEDRQRARVASNAGAYQSVGDYMDKNRIR